MGKTTDIFDCENFCYKIHVGNPIDVTELFYRSDLRYNKGNTLRARFRLVKKNLINEL